MADTYTRKKYQISTSLPLFIFLDVITLTNNQSLITFNRTIKKYYRKTLGYSAFRYIAEYILINIAFKVLFGILGLTVADFFFDGFFELQLNKEYDYQDLKISNLIIMVGLVAPILETIIHQWFTISILKIFMNNYLCIILLAGVLFSLFHLSHDLMYAYITLPGGIIYCWIFYCKYKKSIWSALLYTTAIHSGVNLIAVISIFAGRYWA